MQRGVGRGLAATKPAWMTKGLSSFGSLGEADLSRLSGGNRNEQSRRREGKGNGEDKRRRRGRSSSTSASRQRGGGSGGSRGAGGAISRRRSRTPNRSASRWSRSRSRSRSRSGGRKDLDGGQQSTRNGGDTDAAYRERAVRALEAATGIRVGSAQVGRGRGRGATLPAWMSHPNGVPGGLQQQRRDGIQREDYRPKSPLRRAERASPPRSLERMGVGREGGGRGWGNDVSARGHHGGSRGGRGVGNGRQSEELPKLFSVHKGEVVKIEAFGAFVKLEGYRKHGLVHCSQMAAYRVEDVTDVCKVGDRVFVKVIEVTDSAEPREQRVALSMKLVDQSTGGDLDPSHAEAESDAQRRRPRGMQGERAPVKLDAIFDTTCTKCNGHGHLSINCFARNGQKYDLVPEDDPRDARVSNGGGGAMRGVQRESPHLGAVGAVGRGRGATMPAWMTDSGLAEKLNKKRHRKEPKEKKSKKKSDRKHRHRDRGNDDGDSDSDDSGRGSSSRRHKKSSGHKKHHKQHRHKSKRSKNDGDSRSRSRGRSRSRSRSRSRARSPPRSRLRDGSRSRSRHRSDHHAHASDQRARASERRGNASARARSRSHSRSRSRDMGRGVGGRHGRRHASEVPEWDRGRTQGRVGIEGHAQDSHGRRSREAGGRWQPRADSDRSESRSTR